MGRYKELLAKDNLPADLKKLKAKLERSVRLLNNENNKIVLSSCSELMAYFDSLHPQEISIEQLKLIEKEVTQMEVEVLQTINNGVKFSSELRLKVNNTLHSFSGLLNDFAGDKVSNSDEIDQVQLQKDMKFLMFLLNDGPNINCALQKTSVDDIEKVIEQFDRLSKQIDLNLQIECSRLLDHILSNVSSVSKFAVENVDLLKNLYSLAYHGGTKFPNFLINDS